MNEQEKQVLRTAAERLLAVANGATLELTDGAKIALDGGSQIGVIGGQFVRIRPPAAPPEPKPSQKWLDRHGVELTGEFRAVKKGDWAYDCQCDSPQLCTFAQLWKGPHWILRKREPVNQTAPELPCPPRPTPEQVAAARLNGKRVRLTGQCEEPNGRPWVWLEHGHVEVWHELKPNEAVSNQYGRRRWIAEVIEDVVTPWALDTNHSGALVERKDGSGWGRVMGVRDGQFIIPGWGKVTPEQLKRDWTHDGQPCGEVAK